MKRLLSFVLAITLLFSTVSTTYAVNDEFIEMIPEGLEELVASYIGNFNDPNLFDSEYSVGYEIPAYVLENGEFAKFEIARYFPIYKDGDIWAMVTLVNANTDDPSYTIDQDFPNELKMATDNGELSACLILDFLTVYSYSGDKVSNLMTYNFAPLEGEPKNKKVKSSETIEDLVKSSDVVFNQEKMKNLTLLDVSDKQMNMHSARIEYNPNEEIKSMIYIDQYQQPAGTNICWAITTFLIAQEFVWPGAPTPCPYPRDPQEIVDYRNKNLLKPGESPNKQAGSIDDAQACLRDMYYIYTDFYDRPLTEREIHYCLEDGFAPMYSAWYESPEKPDRFGHTVCLIGYEITPTLKHYIIIMESLTASYKNIQANSKGEYHMIAAGMSVQWYQSLAVCDYV